MRRCASAKKCTFIFMCRGGSYQHKKKIGAQKKHSGAHPDALFQQKLTESAKKSLSLLPKLTYHFL